MFTVVKFVENRERILAWVDAMNNIPSPNLRTQNLQVSLNWALLVLSTLGGWMVVVHKLHLTDITLMTVMGLTALKAALVILFYMDIAWVPIWFKGFCAV